MSTALVRLFGETTGRFLDEFIPERWTLGYDTVLVLGALRATPPSREQR